MKRTILTVMWFCMIIGGAWFLGQSYNPLKLSNFVTQSGDAQVSALHKEQIKSIYDINFIMTKAAAGNIAVYLPRLSFAEADEARYFSEFFGITENFLSADDFYSYTNEKGSLRIDKFGGHLRFDSAAAELTPKDEVISDDEAIELAEDFLIAHLDYFYYEQADASYSDGIFEVLFIDRLGNLKNYGFPTRVTLNSAGHIISVDHYYFIYDKLDNFPIKPMSEAVYGLPADMGSKVDLTGCTLVYYYQNSLLQPFYLFEGKTVHGKYFRSFVDAAVYK